MQELKINKTYQDLIPPLSDEEFAQLEASIKAEGVRDAIVVLPDSTIIDGHNRYEICTKHGILYHTITKEFDSDNAIQEWIIRNQLGRRNIERYVRYELTKKLKPLLAETARENCVAGGGDKKSEEAKSGLPILANPIETKDTRETLAKIAKMSHGTYSKCEEIDRKADEETKQKLRNDEISINQAYNDLRRAEKKAVVQQKIDEHASERTGIVDLTTVNKKYNIIYADPAWQYWESGQKNQSLHYSTMSIKEICDLPVERIADENAVLFLWVTYPILQEAFKVIEAWGFKYSTCAFVWVKRNKTKDTPFFGCGAWTRANSELCLLATRGTMTRLDATVSQVIESPIEEHSRKPAETRDRIEQLLGKLPRIELFSREKIDGWDVWGNEI